MLPLERLIRDNLKRLHLEQGVKAKQSVSLWERVAGPTVAAVTHADGIRDGILYVFTKSSAWSQELSLLREPLIARINAELEQEAVKEIRFQVRRFTNLPPGEAEPVKPPRELTEEERAAVRALTEQLEGAAVEGAAEHIAAIAEKHMQRADPARACPGCGGPLHGSEERCPFCR